MDSSIWDKIDKAIELNEDGESIHAEPGKPHKLNIPLLKEVLQYIAAALDKGIWLGSSTCPLDCVGKFEILNNGGEDAKEV
jgi:hypothetical protein